MRSTVQQIKCGTALFKNITKFYQHIQELNVLSIHLRSKNPSLQKFHSESKRESRKSVLTHKNLHGTGCEDVMWVEMTQDLVDWRSLNRVKRTDGGILEQLSNYKLLKQDCCKESVVL
jgi:hypothetical protein